MLRKNLLAVGLVAALSCSARKARFPSLRLRHSPSGHPRDLLTLGLSYEIVKPGSGPPAKPGQTVLIHETLTVDGKQIFSSRDKGQAVKFLLRGNQVIPGVEETVTGMRVGERRKATVPPALDGRTFDPAFIRPDADRLYDIELVEIVQ